MSNGALSDHSTSKVGMVVDKIYISLNDIDSCNARIKKQLTKFN
jgi:hypothetical protein